jgi:GNAT superfamily N-acetyltransferase
MQRVAAWLCGGHSLVVHAVISRSLAGHGTPNMQETRHRQDARANLVRMPDALRVTVDNQPVVVRSARSEEIIDLRHRVLRQNLPRTEAIFPGDDLPTSYHFAACTSAGEVIGCTTFHLNSWENQPAYQLRGMATDPTWAGKGIGRAVVTYSIDTIKAASHVHLFWCNARLIAIPFYEKLGWRIASERFEIPTAGPHHRMVLEEI